MAGAQYNMGVRYETGKGLAQDGARALKFYHLVLLMLPIAMACLNGACAAWPVPPYSL